MANIKRGISLYSWHQEFYLRQLSLEECIAKASELDIRGIETLGEQMFPGYPHLSDQFYEQWNEWMKNYNTVPTCHDLFLETKKYKSRLLSEDEMIASVKTDIQHAARLCCQLIRVIVITPPSIMERCVEFAEKHNVKLLLEIHAPWTFSTEWIVQHLEVMDRVKSPNLGLVPDMGIFVKKFPRIISERALRDGARERFVNYMVDIYNNREDTTNLPEKIESIGGNGRELTLARLIQRFIFEDPHKLVEYMPYIKHIHGKFYEMTPDNRELSVPYHEIISALYEGGYDGWISAEYEGQRHIQDVYEVDGVEQVRRYWVMLQDLIDKISEEQNHV
jgi:sugar phosphate isomerase/epimerase